MNIRTRLFVQGALFPALGILALVLGGGVLLRQALLQGMDESLTAQAAVEAVSLFDDGAAPHLHVANPQLRAQIGEYAASRAVYGPDGARLLVEEVGVPMSARGPIATPPGPPRLRDVEVGGAHVRELQLSVRGAAGQDFTLVLRASLSRVESVVGTYFRVLGLGGGVCILLFGFVQARLSKWWSDRIRNMTAHTQRMEAGDLRSRPVQDAYADEIGELTVALAQASARLELARAAQDRLVANAAHELRTPLASMQAEIDVTLRRPREAAALEASLREVRAEVARLSRLSTQLLELMSHAQAGGDKTEGDVRAVLGEAVSALETVAGAAGVQIELTAPEPVPARMDAVALRQAFENLVENAVKFSPAGGVVQLSLSVTDGGWRVVVEDEGPGIPEASRAAVFEPFHRLDHRVEGSGLGLAIVREVAAAHGAEVWVEEGARGARVVMEAAGAA